jgi:mRNA-degrading endonuclease RelE of RelBE toxin-antitoxin system
VGNWRVCYTVEANRLIILILTVAQRGDVYERLRRRLEQ